MQSTVGTPYHQDARSDAARGKRFPTTRQGRLYITKDTGLIDAVAELKLEYPHATAADIHGLLTKQEGWTNEPLSRVKTACSKAGKREGYLCVGDNLPAGKAETSQRYGTKRSALSPKLPTNKQPNLATSARPLQTILQAMTQSTPCKPPLTRAEALQQAQAEGLTLTLSRQDKTTYFGVRSSFKSKPYEALVCHGGKAVSLGYFVTAEEAALCVARSSKWCWVAAERGRGIGRTTLLTNL